MSQLPETVLQFGAGRFLRAFADLFIHHANEAGRGVGRVVIVQSTGDDRATLLNQRGGRYVVAVRGFEDGRTIDRVEECGSVSRALVAAQQWGDVLAVARSPQLRYILSNTTESGYNLDPADSPDRPVPGAFPAKLTAVLHERFQAAQPAPTLMPCELREGNADLLQGLVLQLAGEWKLGRPFADWVAGECVWLNTLVDRIVTMPPKGHPLAADPLAVVGEPFAFFAIQSKPNAGPFVRDHAAIVRAPDITPYFLRKVRILNAAHTALLIKSRPKGIALVREAMADPELSAWLEQLLFEEIVPTLEGRVEGGERFARQTLDRFRNPFLDHKFADIAQHHGDKVQVRLVPTRDEFAQRFGRTPALLDEVLRLDKA